MAASAWGVTSVIRNRALWKVNRSGAWRSRRRSSSGSSVSIVVFELGRMRPTRIGVATEGIEATGSVAAQPEAPDGLGSKGHAEPVALHDRHHPLDRQG